MSEKKITDVLPSTNEIVAHDVINLKGANTTFLELENLYNKCQRDGIISAKNQKEIDEAFSIFIDKFKSITKETEIKIEDTKKIEELLKALYDLKNIWYDHFIDYFTPLNFFESKVNDIIKILENCKRSPAESFSKNADSEIKSLEYFKKQLSYNIKGDELQPFPSFSPIYPYNLEDGGEYMSEFMEAISKSQDLSDQFQEFKDLWYLLKFLNIQFEILRIDEKCIENNESSHFFRIEYLAKQLSNYKNGH